MVLYQCTCRGVNINLIGKKSDWAKCNSCGRVEPLTRFKVIETSGVSHIDLNNSYWVNSDGDVVELKDMSIEYIKNVLRMLKRSYVTDELEDSTLYKSLIDEWIKKEGI